MNRFTRCFGIEYSLLRERKKGHIYIQTALRVRTSALQKGKITKLAKWSVDEKQTAEGHKTSKLTKGLPKVSLHSIAIK